MPEHPFGLNESPFADAHDIRFIFPADKRVEAVALLRKRVADGESFVTITGDSGSGKTSVVTELLEDETLRTKVAFIAHPSLTPSELLEAVCIEFGAPLPNPPSKPQALASLEHHLRDLRREGFAAVLVLDEAHGLKTELLEEARLLSNMKADGRALLQTILVGLPELERRLGLPELAQLRQRIAVHCRMSPLTVGETEGYLRHRVTAAGGDGEAVLPAETCHEIHNYTNGIPRDINTLAGRALECAEEEGAGAVSVEHVRIAAGDARPRGIATAPRASAGPQPFELRRKVSVGRPAPGPAHAPERPVDRDPPPPSRPEPRKPPSFLRAQHEARTMEPAAAQATALAAATLEERFRRGGITPEELAAGRQAGSRDGGPTDPASRILGSENVQELGASVLLVGLLVMVLMMTGRWDPVARDRASRVDDPTTGSATRVEPSSPPGIANTVPAEASIDPDTPLPRLPDPSLESLVITPEPQVGPRGMRRQAYGFEVASSNYPDSAAGALRRIMRSTKLPVRIVIKTSGDTYRVVVGPFPQRREAEKAIQELFRSALAERARLVQLPHQDVAPAAASRPTRR